MIKQFNWFLRLVLPGDVLAITLAPFGIYIRIEHASLNIINHESIHWKQQMEMLIIFFYVWYVLEWVVKLFKYGKDAYYYISFEREANRYEDEDGYLAARAHYSWLYYVIHP